MTCASADVPRPTEQPSCREFVGFVWHHDWQDQVGLLLEAVDVEEALVVVRSVFPGWRVSVWNEDDASRAR